MNMSYRNFDSVLQSSITYENITFAIGLIQTTINCVCSEVNKPFGL